MKVLLLTSNNRYNTYCANELFNEGICENIIIEDVFINNKLTLIFKYLFKSLEIFTNFKSFIFKILIFFQYDKYFGNKKFHDYNILGIGNNYHINKNIKLNKVKNINSKHTIDIINRVKPDIIFVFGTSFIKKNYLSKFNCIAINLHSGISPYYRGESIIPPLALKDFDNLGVTIHILNEKSDSGDIFYTKKIKINKLDNFYSIHLKTIKEGVNLFKKTYYDFLENKQTSKKQNLNDGNLYGKKFMNNNLNFYLKAWKNLENYKSKNLM